MKFYVLVYDAMDWLYLQIQLDAIVDAIIDTLSDRCNSKVIVLLVAGSAQGGHRAASYCPTCDVT